MDVPTAARGPAGSLPLTDEMLRSWPSGHLFGLTQDVGMGWKPDELLGPEYLILSTHGGLRAADGRPVALGYHSGHWEVHLLVRAAAEAIRARAGVPFAGHCSDPCDGRTQGTAGMYDSLAYRNDAAIVLRRLIRSLPTRRGVLGVATCDKGLPAMMMALAAQHDLPVAVVPGGVTLPPVQGEDLGTVQTIGARYAHGQISREEAARVGCGSCASPGGGCHFLGTAATAQVVAEALGLTLPHAALCPSGQPIWLAMARHSAWALMHLAERGWTARELLTDAAVRNAMVVHAAFGGSTNLLLHLPAIAHAAGLQRPTVDDWNTINRAVPRCVDVLPNGPTNHPTVRVFMAGGVPEVMLHLRQRGFLDTRVRTVAGLSLEHVLDWWETSARRVRLRATLRQRDGIDPDDVIIPPDVARRRGLTSTVCFPRGNICPHGSVTKATAIDPAVVDADGVYRKIGPARVFTTEQSAIQAIKGQTDHPVRPGDVVVLMGRGPLGSGMEETYQITAALKFIPWGRDVAVVTDARFSGVSTGACIGHAGPEALAGGPIGKLRDGDRIRIRIDRNTLEGQVDFVGDDQSELTPDAGARTLDARPPHPELAADRNLPDDTRLWAALQQVSGGTWGGCVYDVDRIVELLAAARGAPRKPGPGD